MNRILTLLIAATAVLTGIPAPADAQPPKDQLKAQFKAREADLRALKQRGQVGETLEGYVEAVPGASADESAAKVVSDENADRRRLYQILADEINKEHPDAKVKATIETVAVRNAARNIENARPDDFLRVAKDNWIRVKDYPRFQKLSTLKAQGRVGETAAGLVEAVKPEDKSVESVDAVVRDENSRRNAEYKALAEKERVDASVIAKRMAARNIENARVGEMLKDEGGSWRKK